MGTLIDAEYKKRWDVTDKSPKTNGKKKRQEVVEM